MKRHGPGRYGKSSDRCGATAVEMALICPVLFMIIFGLFEVTFGYMAHHLIQDAARQGCRAGACYGASNAVVQSRINTLLQAEKIAGSATKIMVNNAVADVASAKSGDLITVQISLPASKVSLFPVTGYLKGQFSAMCMMRHD